MANYKRKKSGFKRFVKKAVRKVGQAAKKRYVKGNKVNLSQVVSDVALVKRMLNAEKKSIQSVVLGTAFGQVSANASGFYSADVTPIPSQGVGFQQRNGQSIKICSWHMTAQVIQQSAASSAINFKMFIYKIMGDPETSASTFVTEQFQTNAFVGGGGSIVDYNSMINPNRFSEAKLVYFKNFRIAPDNFSNQTGFRTISCGGKINHHIRYDGDTNTVTQGQLIMVILADSGNIGAVSTLSNVPITAINTGCALNYNLKWYYYDN